MAYGRVQDVPLTNEIFGPPDDLVARSKIDGPSITGAGTGVRVRNGERRLAHAYAQCRSNKGAPGIDGQDFADIEAYRVERCLAELALALRQETYRPEPIRRVFRARSGANSSRFLAA